MNGRFQGDLNELENNIACAPVSGVLSHRHGCVGRVWPLLLCYAGDSIDAGPGVDFGCR